MRAARQRGPVFPAPQARGLSRRGQTGTDAPFACSVPESVNKHRDRDLKSGYTDLMVDGAPSPHQSDTTLRWLIDRLRS
ncbi:TPA: hypothetical protein MJD39_23215 [Klebsiella pneumoniae]|jgi:hypothetical protein|nr:hypothetical protein F1D29_24735 [Klebsiella pneumoniae]PXL93974.1 hypothetical protein DMT34_31025 [Klebsiella variicola]QEY81655.1 hypothetical protein C2767_29320 [Klebsiella quasipneumoniae]TWY32871.1 hypothetical protein FR992_22995 [Serratia marcescens]HAT1603669.1 hypothetical protein [Raoultella ornithinolytica]HBX3898159.1 hypothetical protein [Klebsiella pneumoniae subsp. pneumoniae]